MYQEDKADSGTKTSTMLVRQHNKTIVCHARLAVCPCEYLDLNGDQSQSESIRMGSHLLSYHHISSLLARKLPLKIGTGTVEDVPY
jgi:hypothetical protein